MKIVISEKLAVIIGAAFTAAFGIAVVTVVTAAAGALLHIA